MCVVAFVLDCASWLFFFFFQAEDGIRDLTVTGVQTCALPIYHACRETRLIELAHRIQPQIGAGRSRFENSGNVRVQSGDRQVNEEPIVLRQLRSEERRVGEEWRSRWSPDHLKKKKKKIIEDRV